MQVDLEGAREDVEVLKRDLEESRTHTARLEAELSSANKASEISSRQVFDSDTRTHMSKCVVIFVASVKKSSPYLENLARLEEARSHKTRLEAELSSANQAAIKASEISEESSERAEDVETLTSELRGARLQVPRPGVWWS